MGDPTTSLPSQTRLPADDAMLSMKDPLYGSLVDLCRKALSTMGVTDREPNDSSETSQLSPRRIGGGGHREDWRQRVSKGRVGSVAYGRRARFPLTECP